MFICTICNNTFETIPAHAQEITLRYGSVLYRFDGVVHDLKKVNQNGGDNNQIAKQV